MNTFPTSIRRTAVMLGLFALSISATASVILLNRNNAPQKQSIVVVSPPKTPTAVLGEKILGPVSYLNVDGLIGPIQNDKYKGAFLLNSLKWLPESNGTRFVEVTLGAEYNAPILLGRFAKVKPTKQVLVTTEQTDGTTVVWQMNDVTVEFYKMNGTTNDPAPVVTLILSSKKVSQKLAQDDPQKAIDCTLVEDKKTCEQNINCVWFEPKQNGLKNAVQIKGLCAPLTPPPVVTSSLPIDPNVTHRTDLKDPSGITKVPTTDKTTDNTNSKATENTKQTSGGAATDSSSSQNTSGGTTSGGTTSGGSTSSGDTGGTSGGSATGGTTDSGGSTTN